ncbi:pentapeptide repeat-containing protein [Rhodococcus sp. WMMA185]|uniref:pentapeptide repeat-containing protein n=1 Tax=Rhodococcus sp. WMMA185 TaxID=679318 RepID=UPI000AB20CBE|nr:pentapeptide repeat-containing protein [Rhodococcus sp. WMMA185]
MTLLRRTSPSTGSDVAYYSRRTWARRGGAAALSVGLATAAMVTVTPVANAEIVIGDCTIVDNPNPENHTVCPGVDLTGSDLKGLDFSYADLSGATLEDADLSRTKFIGANLTDAEMDFARLLSSDLAGADLTGASLKFARIFDANFNNANLTGANLTYAYLRKNIINGEARANFTDANLTDADLSNMELAGAELSGINLTGADLDHADLTGTVLIPSDTTVAVGESGNATVTWPTPPSLTGTTFENCDRASGSSFPMGTTTVRCTVSTSAGQGVGTFTVTVRHPSFPWIGAPEDGSDGDHYSATVGDSFFVWFETGGFPTPTVTTTSELPAGLTLSEEGVLSGTPTEAGSFPITITATNIAGEDTLEMTLDVDDGEGGNGSSDIDTGSLVVGGLVVGGLVAGGLALAGLTGVTG